MITTDRKVNLVLLKTYVSHPLLPALCGLKELLWSTILSCSSMNRRPSVTSSSWINNISASPIAPPTSTMLVNSTCEHYIGAKHIYVKLKGHTRMISVYYAPVLSGLLCFRVPLTDVASTHSASNTEQEYELRTCMLLTCIHNPNSCILDVYHTPVGSG